jgi:superfamily II DNA or RNA helicase
VESPYSHCGLWLTLVCLGNEHDIDPNNPDRIYTAEEKAWCIADDKARVSNEDRGLVVGAPGSGKTTYLVAQLIDWMQSGSLLSLPTSSPKFGEF